MAKTGRPRKRDEAKQGHYEPTVAVVARSAVDIIPPPPTRTTGDQLGLRALRAWEAFWSSDLVGALDAAGVDTVVLVQWIRTIDRIENIGAEVDAAVTVPGSKGQTVPNRLWTTLMALEDKLLRYANELGTTPRARAQLGIMAGQSTLTADAVNRRIRERRS